MEPYDKLPLVLKNLCIWTAVCSISAAPSFVLGMLVTEQDVDKMGAMALGVVLFILAYTAVSSTDRMQQLKRQPFIARTLYIGYGIRIAQSFLSLVPPFFVVDFVCGVISTEVSGTLTGAPRSGTDSPFDLGFGGVLLATLIQGLLLNVVLFVLLLMIYGVQRLFMKPPVVDPRAVCAACGYDLRGSSAACPECGRAIPAAGA